MKKILYSTFLFLIQNFASAQNFSLQFDGNDDHVQFGQLPTLTNTDFTIEGWFRCVPNPVEMNIINVFQPGSGASIHIEVRPDQTLRFMYRPIPGFSGGMSLFTTVSVCDDVWHHFAAVLTSTGRMILYLDGFANNMGCSDGLAQMNYSPTIEYGQNNFATSENQRKFKGRLDDIRVWEVARTPEQIYLNYKKEMSGLEEGLIAYHKFDNKTSPNDVEDCSPSYLHGTRFGVPIYSTNRPTLKNVLCGVPPAPLDKPAADDRSELQKLENFSLKIMPNPAESSIQIEIPALPDGYDFENGVLSILNENGQVVQTQNGYTRVEKLDVSKLPAGTYFVKLLDEGTGKSQFGKFVRI